MRVKRANPAEHLRDRALRRLGLTVFDVTEVVAAGRKRIPIGTWLYADSAGVNCSLKVMFMRCGSGCVCPEFATRFFQTSHETSDISSTRIEANDLIGDSLTERAPDRERMALM